MRPLVALLLVLGELGVTGVSAFAENSCVECHKLEATSASFPVWQRDQFSHWYGSVHGRHGVTCEKCHGGNPDRGWKWLAHWGVHPSMDPRSLTHYKNVPETCGTCHQAVYEKFASTQHYKNLRADRLAPSCTTCHGFEMDVESVSPVQMARSCAMCHNPDQGAKPEIADAATAVVRGIAAAESAIETAQDAIDLARKNGAEPVEAEQQLQAARARLKQTGELWHTFWLGGFKGALQGVKQLADLAAANAARAVPR